VIVQDWMTREVITVGREASIQEALALMKQGSIRHLPVVDKDKNLQGWVTDADLRGVLIASMLEELTLNDVMVRRPHVASPEMPLEDVAKILLDKRIGGMPVLEDGKLVGIITVIDVMSAFINMMGMLTSSSRLDVKVSTPMNPLHEIARLIRQHNGEVISICHIPGLADLESIYSIRLKKCDLEPIVEDLKRSGVEVLSAMA
jgi:acetoin utilization protein AcuB